MRSGTIKATDTMKAVRIHHYGGPEVLTYEDSPRPKPGPADVLVRVAAAGVNPVDWKIRQGYLRERVQLSFPAILGLDVAGEVEELGPGATRFKIGDSVFGRADPSRDGSYAEYIVVQESLLALRPKSIDDVLAASIPLAALTAWQSLFEAAGLAKGQTILIHGASGGVGGFAVQFARWKGAHVIGTASARNEEFVRELGAHEIINYEATQFEEFVRDADVVFDTIGGGVQERSWGVLKKGGILVSIVSPPSAEKAAAMGVRQAFVWVQSNGAQLAEIAKLVDSGVVKPFVETILPLWEAERAQEISQSGHARGKIVLRIVD